MTPETHPPSQQCNDRRFPNVLRGSRLMKDRLQSNAEDAKETGMAHTARRIFNSDAVTSWDRAPCACERNQSSSTFQVRGALIGRQPGGVEGALERGVPVRESNVAATSARRSAAVNCRSAGASS
jgi:hypothetical protein